MDSAFYSREIPSFLRPFCSTPLLARLADVGMNCGVEYTSFPRFAFLPPYSRLDHSLGASLLVWRFTSDKNAALAALFHDVATPTFAHTVDFLHGDYLTQEFTEQNTLFRIAKDEQTCKLLAQEGIALSSLDVRLYPVAENDSPRLCADRLEYTLGNAFGYGFATQDHLATLLDDIVVADTERGTELSFLHLTHARDFALLALRCGEVYACDEDRYAMQRLSEVLASAIETGAITHADLYGAEPSLVAKLVADPLTAPQWRAYCALSRLTHSPSSFSRVVQVKRRYIDPFVVGKGRLSSCDGDFAAKVQSYLSQDQNKVLCGE